MCVTCCCCQNRNIVATVNLDCRLDLKTIALHARNAEYNPKVSRRTAWGAASERRTSPYTLSHKVWLATWSLTQNVLLDLIEYISQSIYIHNKDSSWFCYEISPRNRFSLCTTWLLVLVLGGVIMLSVIVHSSEPKFDILTASNGSYTLKFQLIAILFGRNMKTDCLPSSGLVWGWKMEKWWSNYKNTWRRHSVRRSHMTLYLTTT